MDPFTIMSGIGSLIPSLFGSSKTTKGNQFSQSNQSGSGATTGTSGSTTTPTEDPLFTMFRQSLLPAIAQQYGAAQKDVYGAPQIAQFVQGANQVYNTGQTGTENMLARRGIANSGAAVDLANAGNQQRMGQITGFESQLPFLNEQARWGRTQDLLGMAENFLGRSPLGQKTSGTTGGTTDWQQTGTDTSTSSQKQSTPGIFG